MHTQEHTHVHVYTPKERGDKNAYFLVTILPNASVYLSKKTAEKQKLIKVASLLFICN